MARNTETNSYKALHGANAQQTLNDVVEQLKTYGAIAENKPNPSYGYEGYDPAQFDAHQEITYADGGKAILYATSSLRSDRIRKDQWRAFNIKEIDDDIEHAFVVLPDAKGFDQGTEPRDEIREGRVFTAIDDIQTAAEFFDKTMERFEADMEAGKRNDLQGRNLEDLFASILNAKENLGRFNGRNEATGFRYEVFELVLTYLDIKPNTVLSIEASTDIPALPSGGNPKTDVACLFTMLDGSQKQITFSLKNTSNRSVSVHEYTAQDFAKVLDPTNTELERLLTAFQRAGSKKDMDPADAKALAEELKPYLKKLDYWVFSGCGAEGTEPVQIADYIVVRNKNNATFSIHTIKEYCDLLEKGNKGSAGFGTVFSWTYPSKKRGQRIQLKGKIID